MKARRLGRTDIFVSEICLGTMTWGEQNTKDEAFEQMDYALTQGVNFFDTAELYAVPPREDTQGKTETYIGEWFAARKNRQDVILATKIAGPGFPWIRGGEDITPAALRRALEGSLKRLQTDYVDLYQLHWPNRPHYHFGRHWDFAPQNDDTSQQIDNFRAILETAQEFINEGKIRHLGLSDDTAWGTMKYLQLSEVYDLPRVVSIQNEYSLLCRIFEPDLSEVAIREDVGLLAWSPLATGMISGKYLNGARPEGTRWTIEKRQIFRDTPQAHAATRGYIAVAEKHGLDVCQMAIAFTLAQKFVTSSIIGATSMDQLKTDIAAVDVILSQEVLADIESVRRENPMPY